MGIVMESTVDALNNAYQEFVAAVAGLLEANELVGGQKMATTDAAVEKFKQQRVLFRVACDQAEEFVESVKQSIGSERLVDRGDWLCFSQTRIGRWSKLGCWLAMELEHGSGTTNISHSHGTAPFDSSFYEDAAQ